jgi:1-deoxy-D-xylulose-5-phosphate synthase
LALGLACARDSSLLKDNYFKVVAVIGDGSLSGGLCFEGLNNAGHLKKDMLVVLNTNELSIAPNVGAISTYLNKIISLPIYNRFKNSLENFAKSRLPKESRLIKIANKFEEGLKGLFIPGMLFEELGFRYFGPFDGHNLALLIPAIKRIINIKGPLMLHVLTKKGKGYSPAENEPVRFHGTGPFEVATGKALVKAGAQNTRTFTEVFGNKLADLAKDNKKIIAITAAMPEGTGLDKFRDLYPERFFDVGIAEGHAICFAAGLAKEGLKPIIALYSTFLQRAYDQIIEEIALQELPVILAIDRAGIVGEDGATHQGIFDLAFLRSIPNLVIMAPKDGQELEAMLELAINLDKPVAMRYPKGKIPNSLPVRQAGKFPACPAGRQIPNPIQLGRAEVLKEGKDFTLIAVGSMVLLALEAAELLEQVGLSGSVINARFIKPLDIKLLKDVCNKTKFIFTVEEGVLEGGFGSAVMETINKPITRIGLPSEFISCGKRDILLAKYGLTAQAIADKIKAAI